MKGDCPMRWVQCTLVAMLTTAYALSAIGHGERLVLCVGADGHIAVETVEAACCEGSRSDPAVPAPQTSRQTARAVEAGVCVSCVDIPLPVSKAPLHVRAEGPSVAKAQSAVAAIDPDMPLAVEPALRPQCSWLVPRPPPTLGSLRTVVLLS